MKLIIVGSTEAEPEDTKPIIREVINRLKPEIVGSGEAKGTDTHVREVCQNELNVRYKPFIPEHPSWHGTSTEGGFKWRNIMMIEWCDRGVRISSLRNKSYGSGWTIDQMEKRGKKVERYEVD